MPKRIAYITFWFTTLIASSSVSAQNALTPEQARATAEIHEYFRRTTARLAAESLRDIKTLDDWQKQRPVLREQLLEMLGLSPLPERTDLHATVTGTVEHEEFIVEKLHFQSRPGLYVTANFYRPKQVEKPLPTILYLCGHGNVKLDGVSYGSKASYQHHPAWFAREGYCSLILDTLQLGEIEGLHHGTYREGMWWWPARGYTPAGVEAWNAVRALDYLESRPEVDMKRVGVTGRSGGGAYTWWLAGIDDRPACLIPVAGITDLENHVVDGCIEGHCDCMYMVNTYQWDFPTLAALAAPRPLLFSNSDKDRIFPLDGVVRTHAKLKKIYDLYGAADKLGLLITEGPHKDTQELQVPAFRWMNRWLQSRDTPITRVADKPFDPKQLKVFEELPSNQRNTSAHEWFVPQAESPPLPRTLDEWQSIRDMWTVQLRDRSFRDWTSSPPPLNVRLVAEQTTEGLRLQRFEFTSDENLQLTVDVLSSSLHAKFSRLAVGVVDHHGWWDWLAGAVPRFRTMFEVPPAAEQDTTRFEEAVRVVSESNCAFAMFPPRGVGPDLWNPYNPDNRKNVHIRRRFTLVGQTDDAGRVWDVCRAIDALQSIAPFRDCSMTLMGRGQSAGLALYAGLFRPNVGHVELHEPTTTHRDGPFFLNVQRTFDIPQAAAMLLPRKLVLFSTDQEAWSWTETVAEHYKPTKPLEFRNAVGK